ncbi:minor capsid protein [Azospirillum sp. B510]|uniref:minor capsid protein n=1 Tax=Alphaproteobacteria TaxID=28211 RepID=UPI0002DC8F50|nr:MULTISPECIES: minor capsid protein [Alphaproteobacteria]
MLLHALLKQVEAGGLGTEGESLFLGRAPQETVAGSVFLPRGGSRRDYAQGLRRLSFQVRTHDPDYLAGEAKALAIADALTLRATPAGSCFVTLCLPQHEPLMPHDEAASAFTFIVNYRADWRVA